MKKYAIAYITCGGGRTMQIMKIAQNIPVAEKGFVINGGGIPDRISYEKIRRQFGGRIKFHSVCNPNLMNVKLKSRIRLLLLNIIQSFTIVLFSGYKAYVTVGSSLSVPIFLFARILGRKCIFVETFNRVEDLSLTGKLVYKLKLSSHFFVVHKNLKRKYPKALYVK